MAAEEVPDELRERAIRLAVELRRNPTTRKGALPRVSGAARDQPGDATQLGPAGLGTIGDVGGVQPVSQARLQGPEVLRDVLNRSLATASDGHDVVADLLGMWGLGTRNVLPAAPVGTTSEVSPIRAAVPNEAPCRCAPVSCDAHKERGT